MKAEILDRKEISDLVRSLFLDKYPEHGEWFELAWEVLEERGTEADDPVRLVRGLGVSGQADPLTAEMARELAILFEAFMQKFPIVRKELLDRLEKSCAKYDAD